MAKKYLTPDFDVTAYDINDVLTLDFGGMDGDDVISWPGTDYDE